jgi:hypothetical protein
MKGLLGLDGEMKGLLAWLGQRDEGLRLDRDEGACLAWTEMKGLLGLDREMKAWLAWLGRRDDEGHGLAWPERDEGLLGLDGER